MKFKVWSVLTGTLIFHRSHIERDGIEEKKPKFDLDFLILFFNISMCTIKGSMGKAPRRSTRWGTYDVQDAPYGEQDAL